MELRPGACQVVDLRGYGSTGAGAGWRSMVTWGSVEETSTSDRIITGRSPGVIPGNGSIGTELLPSRARTFALTADADAGLPGDGSRSASIAAGVSVPGRARNSAPP